VAPDMSRLPKDADDNYSDKVASCLAVACECI
jgi:hypothetical protein